MAEHIRIDEGIPRGKRKMPQRANKNGRNAKNQFLPLLPRDDPKSLQAAINDYRQGATLAQIAATHQVSKEAVYAWLLGDMGGKEHEKLVTQALTARIAMADSNLDSATSPLNLSRAREQARFSRMDLERRRPHLYGAGNQIAININQIDTLNVALTAAASDLLGKLRTVAPQQQIEQSSATEAEVLPPDTNDAV